MRSRARTILAAAVAAVIAVLAGFAGLQVTGAAHAAGGSGLCAKSGSREVVYFGSCPKGYFPISFPAGTTVTAVAPSPVSVVHKTVVVDATFEAGSVTDRTVTVTGLPAYRGTAYEISGSNSADAPAGLNIAVTPAPPGLGSTTRKFLLTPSGFAGTTKSFTIDVWVFAIQP